MNTPSITDQRDYQAALLRLEKIFSAKKGTPEGEELDQLGKAIVEYEERNFPI